MEAYLTIIVNDAVDRLATPIWREKDPACCQMARVALSAGMSAALPVSGP